MRPRPHSETLPRDRVRRFLVALLILCLILLPLYLWPLRGRLDGLPGAAALSGAPSDPRNPGALARIPGDVWDALMGRAEERPSPSPPSLPRSLTMIATLEDVPGASAFETLAPAPPQAPLMPSSLSGSAASLETTAGEDGASSGPVQFLADPSSSEPGTGSGPNGFGSGGYPGLANLGPWGGGGGGGTNPPASSSGPTWTPSDPGAPAPTPEPATIVLVASNLALFGVMAWRRRRRGEETHTSG